MSALGKTHPSFIRCIKPNPSKHANSFNGLLCYEQLQCSGVFEAVTIRRQGYPARMSHLRSLDIRASVVSGVFHRRSFGHVIWAKCCEL